MCEIFLHTNLEYIVTRICHREHISMKIGGYQVFVPPLVIFQLCDLQFPHMPSSIHEDSESLLIWVASKLRKSSLAYNILPPSSYVWYPSEVIPRINLISWNTFCFDFHPSSVQSCFWEYMIFLFDWHFGVSQVRILLLILYLILLDFAYYLLYFCILILVLM